MDRDDATFVHGSQQPDRAVNEAKAAILKKLGEDREKVFYRQQLEVILEPRFFHWITGKALNELEAEGHLRTELVAVTATTKIKIYRWPDTRYWQRRASVLARTVRSFAEGPLVGALGQHGELMVDQAFCRAGFTIEAENVNAIEGRVWTDTQHDLDRVYTKDGVRFGTEIKNTLKYIPREEFEVKLAMCRAFGVVPLFVVRMLPKDYVFRVAREGGFCLVLQWQMYPFGFEELARNIREQLELPVDCPRRLEAGTVQRLANWHRRRLERAETACDQTASRAVGEGK
jgi:hypothetical protein